MKCLLCGGTTRAQLIETDWVHRGRAIRMRDVPADVCQDCQEPYFELATIDGMRDEAAQVWAVSPEHAG